ncbi:DUF397 domain-containing protein [Streptomyces sp. NPDC054841]
MAGSSEGRSGRCRRIGLGVDPPGSSYSDGSGGKCAEVAENVPGATPVRDSKAPRGPRARVPGPGLGVVRHGGPERRSPTSRLRTALDTAKGRTPGRRECGPSYVAGPLTYGSGCAARTA